MVKNPSGHSIEEYKLPNCDVQKEKRSFLGVQKDEYYSLEDMKKGDCSGMTETDHDTSGKDDGAYTPINKTSGKSRDWSGKKLSVDSVKVASDTKVYKRASA